jgi:hypothetical protein
LILGKYKDDLIYPVPQEAHDLSRGMNAMNPGNPNAPRLNAGLEFTKNAKKWANRKEVGYFKVV